jgi:Flp pilus assembly protein TadD
MNNQNIPRKPGFLSLLAALGLIPALVACESKQPTGEATKAPPAAESKTETPAGDPQTGMAVGTDVPLLSPASSLGRAANDEGVDHAQQGHWDVAEGHFRKALEADPKLAEAQFNLGLALDKLGKHDEATSAFKKAAELAQGNTKITESPILKKHTSS